uniref:Fe2OG dioxygenase domain-containing protein n=1 Tax=Leersia perrieri TaxID=77586 RepID=A0A0D9XME4_9ORYZ
MNYYPPCQQADKVIGLSPHTDVVGLMLLLQVSDVQGLQIKRDGKWFSVNALNGALIVNIGDTLEILSNGKFKSVEHRAVIHPNKERISAALFHYPRENLVLSPLPEFVKDGKLIAVIVCELWVGWRVGVTDQRLSDITVLQTPLQEKIANESAKMFKFMAINLTLRTLANSECMINH